jgi:HAE1 family hydrophobic/amphiphilic exporter-1
MTMVMVAIMVLGYASLSRMGVDLYPEIDFPYVSITTIYPGAGPQEIETQVTKPMEDSVSLISGVKNVDSTSQEGISSVMLEFELGTDLDAAVADVRANVDAVRGMFPREAESPIIMKTDISALPVLNCGISSPRPAKEIRDIAEDVISQRLARVPGVAAVGVAGGDVREILVSVDKGRLEAYGLSIGEVAQALAGENLNLPSGSLTEGRKEYAVRAIGEFESLEEIGDVRLQTSSGSQVALRDIAEVRDSIAERDMFTRMNGQDSVTIQVLKQAGANTVEVVNGVKRALESLTGEEFLERKGFFAHMGPKAAKRRGLLPPDINIEVGFDQSVHILDTIAEVRTSLLLGALLAVMIVFLFLHNVRGTIVVAVAIPTSILATFTPIYFAGFTLNMMVLLGLSLSVGILVDDSIVVLENIWRHLRLGEAPREAAFNGRTEIGLAAITITLVDVVVFIPIAFMGGIVGQFFRQFGITIATATLFSLFVSFTLTPMMASRWFRQEDIREEVGDSDRPVRRFFGAFDRFYGALDERYRRLLVWALNHRLATVIAGVIVLLGCLGVANGGIKAPPVKGFLIATGALALLGLWRSKGSGRKVVIAAALFSVLITMLARRSLGFEMFPQTDAGSFKVSVEMPAGTALSATSDISRQIEEHLLDKSLFPEVKTVIAAVGSSSAGIIGMAGQDPTIADIDISLVEKRKRERSDVEIMQEVGRWAKTIPGPRIKTMISSEMGGPSEYPVQVVISSEDDSRRLQAARAIMKRLQEIAGTKDVDISWKVGRPEVQARVDRIALAERELSTFMVASTLRTSLEGSTDTKFREKGNEYDIRVRLREEDRASLEDIGATVVANGSGAVRLEEVASLELAAGPNKIDRRNRVRTTTVYAGLLPGFHEGNVTQQVQKALSELNLPEVSWYLSGETEIREESFANIFLALGLSVILVYILMAALFEGYLSPFIIMFSLPMALVGALLALALTGASVSIVAMIGIIMLMGLVTKNAILLVDYTNTLRSQGMERREALLKAGPTRLRPILMTTLAMIFAMLPIAMPSVFHLVSGAEWRAPMASAVIGGLIVSTLLTLLVIPVLYTVFDDLGAAFMRRLQKILRRVFP